MATSTHSADDNCNLWESFDAKPRSVAFQWETVRARISFYRGQLYVHLDVDRIFKDGATVPGKNGK